MRIGLKSMSSLVILPALIACISASQASESVLEFETRDGLIYVVGEDVPFTGLNEDFYPNGNLWFRIQIESGVPHGKAEFWYENGSKKSEQFYANGMIVGIQKKWSEAGELVEEVDHRGK